MIGKTSTLKEELIAAGYAPSVAAHQPPSVTKAKGWTDLLDKYLPDEKVAETHSAALDATKVVSARIVGADANEGTDDFIDVPDYPTRLKAVDLAYKVKHKYVEPSNLTQINIGREMEIEFVGDKD